MKPAWDPGATREQLSWVVTEVHTDEGITGVTAALNPLRSLSKRRLHTAAIEGDVALFMVCANRTFTAAWLRGGSVWSYERALKTARELEQLGVV